MVVSTLGALAIFALPAFGQYVMEHQDSVTWTEANEYCAGAYGTTLATIKDDADASTLLAMKQNLGNHHIWIGLNNIETENEWVWASGYECDGECDELKWWRNGEPSGGTRYLCGIIDPSATNIDSMIEDISCDARAPDYFVCDKNPTEQPTTSPSSVAPSEEPTAGPTSPTSSPTKTLTKEPSPEPTADPVRDCDVLHIDEFLVDCSVEFEGHDNDIDSLKSDVTTLKDDVADGESAIVALEGTVDNLKNSTSTMDAAIQELEYILSQAKAGHDALEAVVNVLVNSSSAADESIDEIKADIQVIMEQLGKIGDLPAAASVIGGNMDWYQQTAGDSMVQWNGTDMMIAGLVIANVVTMIVLAVVCCGNGSSDKHRYGVVEVGSD